MDEPTKPNADAILRHELLTPLTGIIGIAELLLARMEGADRRHIEGLLASARSMVPIIKSIGGGHLAPRVLDAVDLRDMLQGFGKFAEARAASRQLAATIEIEGAFAPIAGDHAAALRQILINLIDNAVKYTDQGAIAFRATCRGQAPAILSVMVSDTGRGIAAQDLQRIRQLGVRGHGSDDRPGTGIGLGVAITMLETMGGELKIVSGVGKGTDVTLTLPLKPVDAALGDRALAGAKEPPAGGLALSPSSPAKAVGFHVLIVDDNRINRQLIAEILTHLGYRVSQADSGEAALDVTARQCFDAVLMDIEMPGINGIEATLAIEAMASPGRDMPIIAVSAHGADDPRLKEFSGFFADIVAKPIDPPALDAALRLALSQYRKIPSGTRS